MEFSSSPYVLQPASVTRVMALVIAALVPGIVAQTVFFGGGVLVSLAVAVAAALLFEAAMLAARGKPLALFLKDGSAPVTAVLVALAFPATAPWWLIVVGVFFAIVVAKHLYGGLGQNPFNPAMVAFAVCIVSFPSLMSQWPGIDAVTSATPLDHLKTALKVGEGATTVAAVFSDARVFGAVAGRGWEWGAAAYLAGGLALIALRVITWQVPVAFIGAVVALSGGLWLFDAARFASPLFHLFAGSTLLGAFFIATDPVSGATTPTGKLIFGAGAGVLMVLIRVFGGYPDGVAFAVLLMNLCAPVIDLFTQPPVFGAEAERKP